tara:strand:- start:221 stop:484 length:264 start_codon:yes stop_codon:yes gene_type:complete
MRFVIDATNSLFQHFPEIYLLTYVDSGNVSTTSKAIFYSACKQDHQFLPNAYLFSIYNLIVFTQDNSSVEVGIKKIIGKLIDISCIS